MLKSGKLNWLSSRQVSLPDPLRVALGLYQQRFTIEQELARGQFDQVLTASAMTLHQGL